MSSLATGQERMPRRSLDPAILEHVSTSGVSASDTEQLPRFHGYVFDLDGTVYLDDEALPGAVEVIARLRADGARVVFATNKPLEQAGDYAAKLTRLGIEASAYDVVTALDSLVAYLLDRHPGAALLCVAESVVVQTLRREGFPITIDPEEADVVVVSFDRSFDYAKLLAAYRAVRGGAVIVASNPDPYCPTADGGLPDCAAMLAAIEACTGATAEAVVGKPSPQMAAVLLDRLGVPADRAVLIGDRLATDVAMGLAIGMTAVLVLTGATSRADVEASDIRPDHVIDDLHCLIGGSGIAGLP
jgi:HAD superfamily hydrolase (TIGR01450 family)